MNPQTIEAPSLAGVHHPYVAIGVPDAHAIRTPADRTEEP
jgi:hypothetical protein